ncbi:MAG: methyl-accepting chemotaxis protein [Lentisphaeria bacterium]
MLCHFKTGTKIIGLVLVAALFMAGVVANVWKERHEGEVELRQLESHELPLFEACLENGERLTQLSGIFEQTVRLAGAPAADAAAYRERVGVRDRLAGLAADPAGVAGLGSVLKLLDTATAQAHDVGERQRYGRVRDLFEHQQAAQSRLVADLVTALDDLIQGQVDRVRGKETEWRQALADLEARGHELHGAVEQVTTASFDSLSGNLSKGAEVGMWLGLGGLALTLILGWWMARDITRPLAAAVVMAETMASGDLRSGEASTPRQDEAGVLLDALGRMRAGLGGQIGELKAAVSALATSASEVAASTSELAATAAETAASINETTATVEEVKQTARVSQEKSQQVAERAQVSVQAAQAGKKAADETGSLAGRLKDEMATVATTMVTLSEQSQAIGQIIATVDALAEQSSVLAVNAAIEASRAGEQGRCFAVVAQEVKNLAEQSKQATGQVRAILNDIQKSTGRAVMATEHGSKTVDQGVKQARDSGQTILLLLRNVEDGAAAATQIALSSQQQMVGVDQVTLAMETIRQAGQQNAASATQLENAAAGLNTLGCRLQQLTERYHV